MADLRNKLWLNILEDLGPPEGCILPGWLICVYRILFPLHGLRHLLELQADFDFFRMVWTIHGVRFSDRMLMQLANAQGQTFRVNIINGIVVLEFLPSPENTLAADEFTSSS